MMYKLICILLICLSKIVNITAFAATGVCETSTNNNNKMAEVSSEVRLKDDLMCNYEKYLVPLKNRSGQVDIKIDMDIDKYSISTGTSDRLYIQNIITVKWNDEHLNWSPNEYNSINEITINSDDIWKPEILPQEMEIFSNKPSILESVKCKVNFNGNVSCRTLSSHYGYCKSELYHWPYEVHECEVEYMLLSHNRERIITDINENKTIHINEENEDWKIIHSRVDAWNYDMHENILISHMYFFFDVRQDRNNSIQLFYIRLFTLVSLTLLSFWIFFDDASRLVLILINILCHFYELENFQWHMIPVGHTIPYILTIYRDSLILTFIQLIETIALKKLYESEKPVPYLLALLGDLLNYNIIKQILFIQDNKINNVEDGIENENNLEFIKIYENKNKRQIIFFMDRVLLIFVIVSYLIMVMTLMSMYN